LFGIAGYSLNYPASTTNPILYPQVPGPGHLSPGFGNVYANVSILEIIPTVAMKVTDRLSLSAGPTIQSAQFIATPFAFAAPNPNGYATGAGTETSWGMGLQLGAFWQGDSGINLGASYKSPQWFLPVDFHGTDASGLPRDFNFQFSYPQIVSLGTSYTGIERWMFATDVRYFDWKNTSGTAGNPAQFAPDGTLTGLGWRSTWSVSLGSQYQLTDAVALRAGYAFSQSPITDATAGFNVGTPLILQQSFNVGSTLKLSKSLAAHIVYVYQPQNSVNGPFQTPVGPVPGSNVGYSVSAHAISLGLTASF
jgi:long-chain fatty acid transport protein